MSASRRCPTSLAPGLQREKPNFVGKGPRHVAGEADSGVARLLRLYFCASWGCVASMTDRHYFGYQACHDLRR